MALHYAVGDRQPQSGPLAHRFGGVEGVEYLFQLLGRHADTIVRDTDDHLVLTLFAGEANQSFFRNSLGSVHDKVDQHLPHLALIAHHLCRGTQFLDHLAVIFDLVPDQLQRVLYHIVQIGPGVAGRVGVGELFQADNDRLDALDPFMCLTEQDPGILHDVGDILLLIQLPQLIERAAHGVIEIGDRVRQTVVQRKHRLYHFQIIHQRREVGVDVHQRVVDLMRNTRRQHANRCHLLGVDQLRLLLLQGSIGLLQLLIHFEQRRQRLLVRGGQVETHSVEVEVALYFAMFAADHPVSGLDLRVARLSKQDSGRSEGELAECLVQLGDAVADNHVERFGEGIADLRSGLFPTPGRIVRLDAKDAQGGLLRQSKNVLAENGTRIEDGDHEAVGRLDRCALPYRTDHFGLDTEHIGQHTARRFQKILGVFANVSHWGGSVPPLGLSAGGALERRSRGRRGALDGRKKVRQLLLVSHIYRLLDEVERAMGDALIHHSLLLDGGDHDDPRTPVELHDVFKALPAIHIRHGDIQQYHIGLILGVEVDAFKTVPGGIHYLIATAFERPLHRLGDPGAVIDDQNTLHYSTGPLLEMYFLAATRSRTLIKPSGWPYPR